jgi:hypothetical protein
VGRNSYWVFKFHSYTNPLVKFGSTVLFPDKLEVVAAPEDDKYTHRGVHPGVPGGPGIVGGVMKGVDRVARLF